MGKRIEINNSLKLKCPLTGKLCSGTQNKRTQIKTTIKIPFRIYEIDKIPTYSIGETGPHMQFLKKCNMI